MSALRAGSVPVISSCAFAALTALAGCSSTGNTTYTAQDVPVAPRVAQAATVVEDDGLPGQSPPPSRIRAMPDNPDEPFSKNYGGGNPAALGAGQIDHDQPKRAPLPADVPAANRQKVAVAIPQDE